MNSNILILGNVNYIHLQKLERNLQIVNEGDVCLDFFHLGEWGAIGACKVYAIKKHFRSFWYKGGVIAKIAGLVDIVLSFWKLKKYDLINIHFLTVHSFFLLPLLRFKCKKLMISPWGSDVYRVHGLKKLLYKVVYHFADYVSVPDTGFRTDVKKIFGVNSKKIVDVGFGSELVDYILERKEVSKESSKDILKLTDRFIIACGYNSSSTQNHEIIIDAIIENKPNLPIHTLLVFLLTYGKKYDLSGHFKKLADHSIPYITFHDYLGNEDLFPIQNATDIFIHIQDTDANSAFMQEFLLCDALVINGAWLTYEHLEKKGLPYVLVQEKNVTSLVEAIKNVLSKNFISPDTEFAKGIISSFAWSVLIKKWYSFFKVVGK